MFTLAPWHLMQVAATWDDVKSLRQDMERAGSVSYLPFRSKLLQAAANMQSALGLQDLGQFYHESIKDSHGTLVFCTVRHLRSIKGVPAINARWVPINKLKERKLSSVSPSSTPGEAPTPTAAEILLSSMNQQIEYQRNSSHSLQRGLYLGYLKLQSSMEQLRVLVPHDRPNMFPNVKIRDNTHVSREEWELVQQLGSDKKEINTLSPAQEVWLNQLSSASQKLLRQLGISGEQRIYSGEVLDLSGEVSLILMFPSSESLISHPNQEDVLLSKSELIALPIHTFEMVHMSTYQSQLLGRYARLSCILEMDKLLSEHAKREAFSQVEISTAKQRLTQVQNFQEQLDEAWKQMRWVKDAISFARDKTCTGVSVATVITSTASSSSRSHHSSICSQRLSDTSSPPSSPPFRMHHSSSDSIHQDSDKNRFSKYEERTNLSHTRMKKSSTAENVRVTPKTDINFVKSKTSECLYHRNSYDSNMNSCMSKELIDSCDCPKNPIPPSWLVTKSIEPMYRKDQPFAKSECHLQYPIAPDCPLPRKASAPPNLDSGNNKLPSDVSDCRPPIQDSKSLESITDVALRRRRETMTETKEAAMKISSVVQRSPSSSCYDLQYSYSPSVNSDLQRAASSLSHESEVSISSMTTSLKSLSSTETETDTISQLSRGSGRSENSETRSSTEGEDGSRRPDSIIQVFAAYESGLSSGVSVKLSVTNKTTAREVIDMVVKSLNKTVISKKKKGPTYGNDKLKNFCLVAVIDKRERCLRDDFKLQTIQDPWRRGKFYVRFKNDLLAAIEQCTARQSSNRRSSAHSSSIAGNSSSTNDLPRQSSADQMQSTSPLQSPPTTPDTTLDETLVSQLALRDSPE